MAEKNMNDFGFYGQKIEFCSSVLMVSVEQQVYYLVRNVKMLLWGSGRTLNFVYNTK